MSVSVFQKHQKVDSVLRAASTWFVNTGLSASGIVAVSKQIGPQRVDHFVAQMELWMCLHKISDEADPC